MEVRNIQSKTILRKHKPIDSWFVALYGYSPYRGCGHNCTYCDGRHEKYQHKGEIGYDIDIKSNALDLLEAELSPNRKRKPLRKGYIMLSSGVSDAYQPLEKSLEISRKSLEIINKYQFPVHILTKSTLVLRDLDILLEIKKKNPVIVSFSFSSTDEKISKIFEPEVPTPSERLRAIQEIKSAGLNSGVYYMPLIPLITDTPEFIEKSISDFKAAGADFVIFGGMTLKEGRQKQYFMDIILQHFPDLANKYSKMYHGQKYGNAIPRYYDYIYKSFIQAIDKSPIPHRIPLSLFKNITSIDDKVIVLLSHIDYFLQLRGIKSAYGYASYQISLLKNGILSYRNQFNVIPGVNKEIEKQIIEIIETGNSSLYQQLIHK